MPIGHVELNVDTAKVVEMVKVVDVAEAVDVVEAVAVAVVEADTEAMEFIVALFMVALLEQVRRVVVRKEQVIGKGTGLTVAFITRMAEGQVPVCQN